jgi:hypothetical protein
MPLTPRPQNSLRGAALFAALLTLLLTPGLAAASSTQESIFEDEHELLQLGPARQAAALDEIAGLGADTIRSLVTWQQVAPKGKSKKRPTAFDGANPAAYPADNWDRYDDLVRGAQARGMSVLLSPSSPIPAWASGCGGSAESAALAGPTPASSASSCARSAPATRARTPTRTRAAACCRAWTAGRSGTSPTSPAG